jgi:putative ABC transport system permease protein
MGAGSVLATLGTRLLSSRLYGVADGDPFTLAAAAGVLLLVATVAVYVPARRASRLEPMVALRRV